MLVYHGTTRTFDVFDPAPEQASGSLTATWGTYFSASPQIAAHFTLKPEVVDAGYDTDEGSRSLVRDPWQFDAAPFQAGAQVLTAEVTLNNPKVMDAVTWVALVEDLHGDLDPMPRARALRAAWEADGHDGLFIPAWDGHHTDADGMTPSVETDADTWVVFDAHSVRIVARQAAETPWPARAPTPERRRRLR